MGIKSINTNMEKSNMSKLEAKIVNLRLEMYEAYNLNPHSGEVLKISQELDKLINEYIKKKSNPTSS